MTLLRRTLLPLGTLLVALLGCTAAQLTTFDQAIEAGQAALVPAESIACAGAGLIDPTGKTAICTVLDDAGNAVGAGFTVAEDAAAIAALLSKTAPKSPAVGDVLKTALAARAAKLSVTLTPASAPPAATKK